MLEVPESQIPIPDYIYAKAIGNNVQAEIRASYLKRRKALLEAIAEKKKIFCSFDCDGTITEKTLLKVENTRSAGSKLSVHFLRLFLNGLKKLNGIFEINTARTGPLAGPSITATEGPRFMGGDGKFHNPRYANEISSVLAELGVDNLEDPSNLEVFNSVNINGLSGGLTHRPGQALKLRPEIQKYGELVQKLNSINLGGYDQEGFLANLEAIVANKKEANPLRVLEYKAIPEIFVRNPNLKIEDYLRYIDLVKKSRLEKWTTERFATELEATRLKSCIDPSNTLDRQDPDGEAQLTASVRKGMIACLTPHALDSWGVIREDRKLKIYKVLADFCASPELRAWAKKYVKEKHNKELPDNVSLFTINGRSVDHLSFTEKSDGTVQIVDKATDYVFKDLNEVIKSLKDNGQAASDRDYIFMDVKDNHPQPYLELAPNTAKDEVIPSKAEVDKNNYLIIAAGDSPGTDAVALAQSILLGGFGYIVRGLMDSSTVADQMVELLTKPQNAFHPYALRKLETGNYELLKAVDDLPAGTSRSKKEWSQLLEAKYSENFFKADNIHQMNAMNASIFAELFAGDPDFKLDLDPKATWLKAALDANNKIDLTTPDCGTETTLATEVYEKSILQRYLPIEKLGPLLQKALAGVSLVLTGAGAVGIVAETLGQSKIARVAQSAQRIALGFNNIVSGVSRGLIAPAICYPWQFIGEMIGLSSTFFDKSSIIGRCIRAFSSYGTLVGRGNELIMRANMNLDEHAKDPKTQGAVNELFNGTYTDYKDIRQVAAKLTNDRMRTANRIEQVLGAHILRQKGGAAGNIFAKLIRFGAEAIADLIQGGNMLVQTISVPAFSKDMFSNFFGYAGKGLTRLSKNSGRPYNSPFSTAHQYATLGFLTATTSILGGLVSRVNNNLGEVISNLANVIPTFGIVTTGKEVKEDPSGDSRYFTTVTGNLESYSPEAAGTKQIQGGWLQALGAILSHWKLGQFLFEMGTGLYLGGVSQQIRPAMDGSAVNALARQNRYISSPWTTKAREFARARVSQSPAYKPANNTKAA